MSDYMDIWFIDHSRQLRNLFIYFMIGVLLFVFCVLVAKGYNNLMYEKIQCIKIDSQNSKIDLKEAKATYENGYIKGSITNEYEDLSNKKLEFSFYTERVTEMGKEYVLLDNILANETKNFEVKFKYENVKYFTIKIVDK